MTFTAILPVTLLVPCLAAPRPPDAQAFLNRRERLMTIPSSGSGRDLGPRRM